MPTFEQITEPMDCNVYEAAKERIKHVIDIFDTLVVCFSGGKDSLVTLHLVKEVYDELGITKPVNVIFRDEEVIPEDVIDFVQSYREKPWVNMLYFACQLESNKYILGKTYEYIQWDKRRKWMREKPPFAITMDEDRIYHSERRCPVACAKYWEAIAHGACWPAVHRHDFGILARDHGIY